MWSFWPKMNRLFLSANSLTGTIGAAIGNWLGMTALALDHNMFSGTLPDSMGNCVALSSLSLEMNNFVGSVPESFGNFSQMINMDLSYNSFSGTLPASLNRLKTLSSFNVDQNGFSGTFPDMFNTPLSELVASSNNFVAPLPTMPPTITSMNMSFNKLSGVFAESYLLGLPALGTADFTRNLFTGPFPDISYWSVLNASSAGQLHRVSLLGNNFWCPVPAELCGNSTFPFLFMECSECINPPSCCETHDFALCSESSVNTQVCANSNLASCCYITWGSDCQKAANCPSGMSWWAVTLIVLACLAAVAVLVLGGLGAFYWFYWRPRRGAIYYEVA